MTRVRFLQAHRMYMPGETAGFPDAEAEALIAAGKAVDADAASMVEAQKPAADTEVAAVDPQAVADAASIPADAAIAAQAPAEADAVTPAKKRG